VTPGPATVGTAGHIDHGKTALVHALTGVDTDRLPEERRRGISIALGYASLALPSGRSLSVVDVPGHERFVRTMVAGASGVDVVLLVVACDDGVMPQTREHLAVCRLLDIPGAVVALTKRDLVDADTAALARDDVAELLAGTRYAAAPVVETSVPAGDGLDELRAALDRAVGHLPARPSDGPVRLPADRRFTLRGIGTVITGTLWSGSVATGDTLAVEPGGGEARVRSVEVHDAAQDRADAGQRVAVSLVGELRGAGAGSVLVTPGAFPASYRLDVALEALPEGPGLRHGELVHVLHATAALEGRVALLERSSLEPGERGLAQLRLGQQAVAARGDHIVLRVTGPAGTVAGGVVLDPAPPRHGATPAALDRLAVLAGADDGAIVARLLVEAEWPAALGELAPRGVLTPSRAAAAIDELATRGEAVSIGPDHWLAPDRLAAIRAGVAARLADRARAEPLDPVVPLASLLPDGAARDALLARLAADGVLVREGGGARAPGGRAEAAAVRGEAAAQVARLLDERGFTPPDLDALAAATGLSRAEVDTLVRALEREGSLVRFGGDLALPAERFAEARSAALRQIDADGAVTLAGLRDALGTSRRVAQALLERLDADGDTRRVGDRRVRRRRSSAPG
jgi:selenocysteine-specific elongation factor